MERSGAVCDAILGFFEAFSSGDPQRFADALASVEGVSVIGSAPGEGHDDRESWIAAYRKGMAGGMAGTRLEGGEPRGYEEGSLGWGVDTPSFVLPDGSRLSTRLTAVLRREDDRWKIVHLHFSVGVPDEEAVVPAPAAA
jgi:hypothetical protein